MFTIFQRIPCGLVARPGAWPREETDANKLVDTGDAKLEEWSGLFRGMHKDRKWGTGASAEGGTGENWLGKILMEIRDTLNKYMAEM